MALNTREAALPPTADDMSVKRTLFLFRRLDLVTWGPLQLPQFSAEAVSEPGAQSEPDGQGHQLAGLSYSCGSCLHGTRAGVGLSLGRRRCYEQKITALPHPGGRP